MAGTLEMTAEIEPRIERVASLLGGRRLLKGHLSNSVEIHQLLLRGLPAAALRHLVGSMLLLQHPDAFEKALGMSFRTFQRHQADPGKALNREQSGRVWSFAGIVEKATSVLGSREEAEAWLKRPALGLNQSRPLDLLETVVGRQMVEDLLVRMEYGVYT